VEVLRQALIFGGLTGLIHRLLRIHVHMGTVVRVEVAPPKVGFRRLRRAQGATTNEISGMLRTTPEHFGSDQPQAGKVLAMCDYP